ncbi:hypothetical protein Bca4012_059381 [Brassica carinata]
METFCGFQKEDEQIDLPPGFRFHPTDEELISQYLHKKVLDISFSAKAIGEVDLNKSEPWELPWMAKMGEKEWYFFCVRDKKYPTGLRTNRATEAGYWKATGKDKEIYRGRAPKGQKTNWVMHEYRLEGNLSAHNLPKTAKNEWVICRVFQKTAGGKKIPISSLIQIGSLGTDFSPSLLPSLTDKTKTEPVYVPCFSNQAAQVQGSTLNSFSSPIFNSIQADISHRLPLYQSPMLAQERSVQLATIDNNTRQSLEAMSVSQETAVSIDMNTDTSSDFEYGKRRLNAQADPSYSTGLVDPEPFWNY